jgi:hypothetical protein
MVSLISFGFLLFAQGGGPKTYSLIPNAMVGDYSALSYTLVFSAEDSALSIEYIETSKVLSIDSDGNMDIEYQRKNGEYRFDNESTPLSSEPVILRFDREGNSVIDPTDEKPDPDAEEAFSIDEIMDQIDWFPKAPVKLGESWKVNVSQRKADFTLVGKFTVGGVPCLKISTHSTSKLKNRGGEVVGDIWIREQDFRIQKIEISSADLIIGKETPPGRMTLRISRVEK